ncbi:hypothetical protein AURDEDRAFT_164124 [Auricularia subglabra TFB-10046 SS5]|nr:hypothetical protein AURDEDRAFT_164124 [Auricularia subglabra TFB-10046 SS5]
MLVLLLSGPVSLARARLVNITIGDTYGDARSGLLPEYTPKEAWGNSTTGAAERVNGTASVRPSKVCRSDDRAYSSHATINNNIQCNITMLFHGTTIYTFMDIHVDDGMELPFFLDDEVHIPAKTYT